MSKKRVTVVTNTELGWDCVVDVYAGGVLNAMKERLRDVLDIDDIADDDVEELCDKHLPTEVFREHTVYFD